jgi:hypothetical protein
VGRPVVHLDSPLVNKERIALDIARRDNVTEGRAHNLWHHAAAAQYALA